MDWANRLGRTFNSLTGRIITGGLLIHAVLIPLLFFGISFIVKDGFQTRFVDQVRSNAFLFAALLAHETEPARIDDILSEAMLGGQFIYAELLVVENGDKQSYKHSVNEENFTEDFFFGQHGDSVYYIAIPLPDGLGATRMLRLGYDEEPVLEQINRLHHLFLYLTIGYILSIMLLSTIFGPLIARPLARLRNEARKIAQGVYDRKLNVKSSVSEIASLSQDLEIMRNELVRHNKELEYQSMHDALTDLPNRVLLRDRLHQALLASQRNDTRLALMMLDLDGFKEINDTLGHHNGDLLLQNVAARMQSVLQPSDTVARLGGDEFAVLIPSTGGADEIVRIARLLNESLAHPVVLEQRSFRIGMSIGIALCPDHGMDESTLMRRADIAMYVAKRNQLDYNFYDASQDRHSLSRLSLMWELRHAVDNNELELHFQPIIGIHKGDIAAVEATLRWRHPTHGLIMPDDFIPLAEQSGLIKELSTWVINEALLQCSLWRGQGYGFQVSVNLSARNLHDSDLPNMISAALVKRGVRPEALVLEITENAFISDPVKAAENLNRLHDMGATLSIDDFGTGYSSLSYLKRLPIDEIKIDRTYICEMLHNKDDAVIVRSTIDLAHNMGLGVVAEGVESADVLDALQNLGCDKAQGYHIARPLTATQFEQWHRETRIPARPDRRAAPE